MQSTGYLILCLNGKFDIFSKNNFRETAEKYKETGAKGLILDFEGITCVDNDGLGILTCGNDLSKIEGASHSCQSSRAS